MLKESHFQVLASHLPLEVLPDHSSPSSEFLRHRWVWWHTLVNPVLGRLRQEDHRFEDSLTK